MVVTPFESIQMKVAPTESFVSMVWGICVFLDQTCGQEYD